MNLPKVHVHFPKRVSLGLGYLVTFVLISSSFKSSAFYYLRDENYLKWFISEILIEQFLSLFTWVLRR